MLSAIPAVLLLTMVAVARVAAGIEKVDYLLITHFHADHLGGVPELAQRLPIVTFVDHDTPPDTSDPRVVAPFRAYAAVRSRGRHINARPGDRLDLKGLDVQIVSSDGAILNVLPPSRAAPTTSHGTGPLGWCEWISALSRGDESPAKVC